MSIEAIELFDIFSETFGKEKAQLAVKDIEALINDHKRELAIKTDILELKKEIKEIELKIEQVRSNLIKWVVGLVIAQTSITVTLVVALLK